MSGRYLQPDPLGQSADISLYRYAVDTPMMKVDPSGRSVWGFDLGVSGFLRRNVGALSVQLVFDSNGTFAVQLTEEAGPGVGKGFGAFTNLEFGSVPTVEDLEGYGVSASASAGPVGVALDLPFSFGNPCKDVYTAGTNGWVAEAGRSFGAAQGAGVALSHTSTLWSTTIFGDIGRWWGNHIYDWTHW